MNKKRLSVVMAGAMLASSVAPVLAATESELDTSKLGSLVEKVYDKLTTGEKFDTTVEDANSDKDLFDTQVALAGKSVYFVKITKDGVVQQKAMREIYEATEKGQEETLRLALQEAFKGLTAEDKVEIYSFGFRKDENDKIVSTTTTEAVKYIDSDFAHTKEIPGLGWSNETTDAIFAILGKGSSNIIHRDTHVRVVDNTIRVYFNPSVMKGLDASKYVTSEGLKLLTINKGDKVYDFSRVILKNKTIMSLEEAKTKGELENVETFVQSSDSKKDIANTLEETIKITGTVHNYKTEDLYDGLMLTTEGHNLLSIIKDNDVKNNVVMEQLNGQKITKGETDVKLSAVNSEYGFTVKVTDAFGKTTKYTVKGAKKQTEVVASWFADRLAKVDILAGDNRYETAVEIAKEQARVSTPKYSEPNSTAKKVSKIVLVNGNSLVDGLSAAPLAAYIKGGVNNQAAPILLTEADALPKATKAYLYELMTNQVVGSTDKVEISLVGGTTVLSRSLEKELESMGFDVVRYGGSNREDTSLKVAEKINGGDLDLTDKNVFVVGAEGEADAMSISGYASSKSIPVIVAKKGGISYDGLEALENSKVTVIGGNAAVSESEYEEMKEEAKAIRRIEGANRQATNAAIIKEFYHGEYLNSVNGVKEVKSVIVAKDGRGNKTALVDALTAANLAAQTNAPVVLATKSLSADQLDALQLRGKSAESLYQVGHGVERSIMETVASKLGLLHK